MVTLDYDLLSGINYIMFAELGPFGIAYEDTALRLVNDQSSEYTGAVFSKRRWVARAEQRPPPDLTEIVRVAYSDAVGAWHEVESRGYDSFSCALAPVSDSVALLAHCGGTVPLMVETLTNGTWTDSALADPRPGKAIYPRFALRKSGAHWLGWSTVTSVRMASNQTGPWVLEDVLLGEHPPFETFVIGPIDLSRDGRERPLVTWGAFGSFRDVVCVAFPTSTGWTRGFEIPGSDAHYLTPTVARDINGDGWFAWQVFSQYVVKWTHTYVKATASKPWFRGFEKPQVQWALSERAPESRWTVLRATGGGAFDSIGSVVAQEDTLLSFLDASAPSAVLRYRIRRESVNRRYEWLSPEATWYPKKPRIQVKLADAHPAREVLEFAIEGAGAGDLDVRLYDVQGREVWREQARAHGSGTERVRLELSRAPAAIRSGLYFIRVTDSTGQTSSSLKTVVIR